MSIFSFNLDIQVFKKNGGKQSFEVSPFFVTALRRATFRVVIIISIATYCSQQILYKYPLYKEYLNLTQKSLMFH